MAQEREQVDGAHSRVEASVDDGRVGVVACRSRYALSVLVDVVGVIAFEYSGYRLHGCHFDVDGAIGELGAYCALDFVDIVEQSLHAVGVYVGQTSLRRAFRHIAEFVGYLSGCDEVGAFGVIDLDVKSAAHHLVGAAVRP